MSSLTGKTVNCLSSPQDRASAQQQLWMVEDTLAGLGGPQKPPHNAEPDSPSPALQVEESSEREVRLTSLSASPASCPIYPGPSHHPLTFFSLPFFLSANQPQASIQALEAFVSLLYCDHCPVVCWGQLPTPPESQLCAPLLTSIFSAGIMVLEIDHGGSICTTEISKTLQTGVVFSQGHIYYEP